MRSDSVLAFLCLSLMLAMPVAAKDGVEATVYTDIPAHAAAGSKVVIEWTLENQKSGRPFSALGVFIRLFGPDGDSTEAFADYPALPVGTYKTTATIPKGGVVSLEIGVAGTMTDRAGNSSRSDWLMVLANNPVKQ